MRLRIGEWGDDDADASTRRSVGLNIWVENDQYKFEVIDAEETSWSEKRDLPGQMLTREEAVKLEEVGDYYHIVEHALRDDQRVATYFETN